MSQVSIQTIRTISHHPLRRPAAGHSACREDPRYCSPATSELVQAVFEMLREDPQVDFRKETLVVGGDGRYYKRPAIPDLLRMRWPTARPVMVARDGHSVDARDVGGDPAPRALGGLVLSASHNPGGSMRTSASSSTRATAARLPKG